MKNLNGRKTALTFGICILLSAPIFMSCNNSPKEKLDDAATKVTAASADLIKANDDYLAEVVAFKADAETQIAANEQKIKEYNTNLKMKKTNVLKKKVADLEKKTADLKQKIADFKADDGKESWSEFKTEFNHDMQGLGEALNDLTKQNTKK